MLSLAEGAKSGDYTMPDTDKAQPVSFPKPPAELHSGNWLKLLAFFGPGAIMASVTITSGETLFASRSGATFGYAMLWCLLAGAIMKGVQVYGGMRFIVVTGYHPMESWAHLPGPRAWAPILIGVLSVVCFPFWLSGLPKMLGQITNWICGLKEYENVQMLERLWATFFIAVAVTITLLQTYRFLEKAETVVLVILLISVFVAVIASKPDWLAALLGAVKPTIPKYQAWVKQGYPNVAGRPPWVEIGTYVGALGGGTYDYLGYVGMLREKGWGMLRRVGRLIPLKQLPSSLPDSAEEVQKSRTWLRAPIIDCSVSFACVLIFTAAFLILGARILHPDKVIPDGTELFNHQARFLTRMHDSLLYVYQVGVFMAFFGTIAGAYEIYTRTTAECLRGFWKRAREMPLRPVRLGVVIYTGALGLLLVWTVRDPVKIVTIPALLGGVFTCGLWCFGVVWAEHRFLPKAYRMKGTLLALTVIAGTVMTAFGLVALYLHFSKLIGG
jgi:Mn2+/Fe2+ NRAMP family transporter